MYNLYGQRYIEKMFLSFQGIVHQFFYILYYFTYPQSGM